MRGTHVIRAPWHLLKLRHRRGQFIRQRPLVFRRDRRRGKTSRAAHEPALSARKGMPWPMPLASRARKCASLISSPNSSTAPALRCPVRPPKTAYFIMAAFPMNFPHWNGQRDKSQTVQQRKKKHGRDNRTQAVHTEVQARGVVCTQ